MNDLCLWRNYVEVHQFVACEEEYTPQARGSGPNSPIPTTTEVTEFVAQQGGLVDFNIRWSFF
jgi:hypothetical protein